MATLSPGESGGERPLASSGYGSADSSTSRSPLSIGLGFLKTLGSGSKSEDKNANRDGQPKRRGPKPDSKPALTRRQELNRQAQRTHRERKEVYIKALEEQVMQLKEVYTGEIQEKKAVADENRKLRELLQLHGISLPNQSRSNSTAAATGGFSSDYSQKPRARQGISPPASAGPSMSGFEPSQAGSTRHGGYQSHFEPHQHYSQSQFLQPQFQSNSTYSQPHQQRHEQVGLDHEQLGVDFVLALESPCMAHLQYMCVRSTTEPEPSPNGHTLMLSCPPFSHIMHQPEVSYQPTDVPKVDLMHLLQLSKELVLDGEMTPVQALNIIRGHDRYGELTKQDFAVLGAELTQKTRCYGFGAVLEEFELYDALTSVFNKKVDRQSSVVVST